MKHEAFGTGNKGHLSLAVKANGFVFVSGNVGFDPGTGDDCDTGELPPDIEGQTRFTLLNLENSLKDAGSDLSKVVKVNVYMDSVEDEFDRMSAAYWDFFAERGITVPPARTTVGVRLPWAKVEMEMVALA